MNIADDSRTAEALREDVALLEGAIALRDKQIAELRELMSEARSMVASAAAIGIKRGVTEWLAKVDAARKVQP